MSTQATTSSGPSNSNGITAESAPIEASPDSTVSANIISQAAAAPPYQPPAAHPAIPETPGLPMRMPGVNPNWARAFADREPMWSYDAPPTVPDWAMPGNMRWPLNSSSNQLPVKWEADKNNGELVKE